MSEPDAVLEQRAIDGDREALTALLERHGPAVRGLIAAQLPKRLRPVLGEDDVLQQAYVDVFRAIGRFVPTGPGSFRAWLATIAKRNLVDAIRMHEAEKRGGDRQRVPLEPGADSYTSLYDHLGGTSSPSRKAARQEAREALAQALEALPPNYRQVVELYDLKDRPIAEVAQAVGRSTGAVYMIRARAHRLLSEAMGTASRYLSDSA